jgi:ParB family chromosome partitioning protein
MERPSYDSPIKEHDTLRPTVEAKNAYDSPAEHAACPGHVAWVARANRFLLADGTLLPAEAEVDEETTKGRWIWAPSPAFGCSNPAKHGHVDRYGSASGTGKKAAADMTETERDEAKAQRRLVRENNTAWDSAETVRREWVKDFLTRKTPPKGTAGLIATALARDPSLLSDFAASSLTAEWIGGRGSEYGRADTSTGLAKATENRALVIALAHVLAAYEAQTSRASWRSDGTGSTTGRYLRFIEGCGYVLSEVEVYAKSKKTA